MKRLIKRIIPRWLLEILLPAYHFLLAIMGALLYRFPSRKLIVVGITGTKGKSSTAEILGAIFEGAGYKTAVLGTIKFQIGEHTERNIKKMTMPGRFFVQHFLRQAVDAGCTHAVIEMTSEGAKQYRQCFIDMDALIFTNLSPEHIESHGSYEKYRDAKLKIARTLSRSSKKKRLMVANADDIDGERFLSIPGVTPIPYYISDGKMLHADDERISFVFREAEINSPLGGVFNAMNVIAAATCAAELGLSPNIIATGISQLKKIDGRMEHIDEGQGFPVIVDYAHTPDSLEALYKTFTEHTTVCVLGNTGGGRDKWKRPVMGQMAERYCSTIILTNEDPYDEDPLSILDEMATGMTNKKPEIILDRREAIARALTIASSLDKPAVLITGKGTDPYIMGPNNTKMNWDDRQVARDELQKQKDR